MAEPALRLATWAEVETHLTARFPDAVPDAAGVALTIRAADGTSQTVRVAPFDALGAPWLQVVVMIGTARHTSPSDALLDNLRAPIGALGVKEGQLALRQTLPLAGVRARDLDETIAALVQECAARRKRMGGYPV